MFQDCLEGIEKKVPKIFHASFKSVSRVFPRQFQVVSQEKGQAKVEIIIPNPAPEYSRKNRCSVYINFNECALFFSEYCWAARDWIKNYWKPYYMDFVS